MPPSDPTRREAFALTLAESGALIFEVMDSIQDGLSNAFRNNPEFFADLARIEEGLKNLPERQKSLWIKAAHSGWHMYACKPIFADPLNVEDHAAFDAFMVAHLRQDWDEITSSILSAHPERSEVLRCAFDLHVERRYIASIPLFLAQTDGICEQRLGAYLFADKIKRERILADIQASKEGFHGILLEILGLNTQFGARINQFQLKQLAPNRNGILHGSSEHLDYGTEINSFKAFSLLAFVAFVLKEHNLENYV